MKWIFSRRKIRPIEQLEESLAALRSAAEFVPTPWGIARQMLELAGSQSDDMVYDLGSGDGRIPILAAQEFGCSAVGIERDLDLWRYSQQRVDDLELADWLILIQLPRCCGVNSQARKFITVAVLAGVMVPSARCEVTPHWPLPLGPPIMPTVGVPVASGLVAEVIGGSGKTPYLPVKFRRVQLREEPAAAPQDADLALDEQRLGAQRGRGGVGGRSRRRSCSRPLAEYSRSWPSSFHTSA